MSTLFKPLVVLSIVIAAFISSCTREVVEPDIQLLRGQVTYTHPFGISYLSFCDSMNGMVHTLTGYLLKTTDGGRSWDTTNAPAMIRDGLILVSPSVVFSYNENEHSSFSRSLNAGQTWTSYAPFDDYLELSFYSPTEGVAFARPYGTFVQNGIMKTTDGGVTWSFQGTDTGLKNQMVFTDALRGYGINGNDQFVRTVNGGQNWTIEQNNCRYFSRISASGTCFLITDDNIIFKSTDFGANWVSCFSDPAGNWFSQVDFNDEGLVVVAAAEGALLISRDFGATWKYMQLEGEAEMVGWIFWEVKITGHNTCAVVVSDDIAYSLYHITIPQ